MADKKTGGAVVTEKVGHSMAIVCLLLNIFLFPWLGTLLGKHKAWKMQLGLWIAGIALMIISFPLMFILIGFLLAPLAGIALFAVWIWGIVTGVQILKANP